MSEVQLSQEEQNEGFVLLFNGEDLDGWTVVGEDDNAWSVQNGMMVCNGAGRGWIRPVETYTDFVLRLDYRIYEEGNSGIFIRTSEEGRPAFQGMEIQLLDGHEGIGPEKENGAIYDSVGPSQDVTNPAGEWNAIEVSCEGAVVRVVLNGTEIVNCDTSTHPDLKDRMKSGLIGLQNHRTPIDFRIVRIKVL